MNIKGHQVRRLMLLWSTTSDHRTSSNKRGVDGLRTTSNWKNYSIRLKRRRDDFHGVTRTRKMSRQRKAYLFDPSDARMKK